MGKTVVIMDSTTVRGAGLLGEARAAIRKLKPLNVRIPAMRIRGDWKMAGFDFSFEDWEDAFPPLGSLYLKAGEKRAFVQPTEDSELEIFFVFDGEELDPASELAIGDLFEE